MISLHNYWDFLKATWTNQKLHEYIVINKNVYKEFSFLNLPVCVCGFLSCRYTPREHGYYNWRLCVLHSTNNVCHSWYWHTSIELLYRWKNSMFNMLLGYYCYFQWAQRCIHDGGRWRKRLPLSRRSRNVYGSPRLRYSDQSWDASCPGKIRRYHRMMRKNNYLYRRPVL